MQTKDIRGIKKTTKSLVLARYNEDVSWTKEIVSYFDNIFIYNKGSDTIDFDYANVKNVNNVGRESQTYVQFIIDNYNTMTDYVLFSQARPEDRGWDKDINKFITNIKEVSFCSEPFGALGWVNVETLERQEPIEEHKFQEMRYRDEFESLFKTNYPKAILYSSGATLWVSSKNIKSRSLKFYCHLNERLNKDIHPPMAWIVERFWALIFSPNVPSLL
jgi:hypothetical protein